IHGEGFDRRDGVRTFLRLGANETLDYYEIEQPVYPFEVDPTSTAPPNADSLWQTNVRLADGRTIDLNSINIPLEALNRLKAARDADPTAPTDEPWTPPGGIVVEGLPPGAVLRIRGNPSLRTISTIAMGVVNGPGGDPAPLENVEVWFNELRVTGYEEGGGWSAYARTVLRLADFADVNARYSRTTDGFGELSGGLGTRTFADRQEFSVLGNVNLHRLVPERLGIAAPLSFSVQQNMTSPRFDPRRGDIRVSELVRQAETDPSIPDAERDSVVSAARTEAQTYSASRSLRVQLSKTGSRSPWLRYTLDGLTLVYTTAAERGRSPSQTYNNRDSWSGSFAYRLAVPRARTVRPFWFTEDVPVLGVLGRLRLNYLPQSFRFAANANRSVTRDRERLSLAARADSVLQQIPLRFITPERGLHLFGHDRDIDFQYNPFTFLALGYRSNVQQSLASAGADRIATFFLRDSLGNTQIFEGVTRAEAFLPGGPGREFLGIPDSVTTVTAAILAGLGAQAYETTDLRVRPLGQVIGDLFSGNRSALTDRYAQTFTATFQPTLDRVRALAWFRLQPVSYTAQFNWDFVPLTGLVSDTISADDGAAGVQAQLQLRGGVSIRPREFWRLFPFYRRMEEADRNRGQAAAAARAERGRAAGERTAAGRPETPVGDAPTVAGTPPTEGAPPAAGGQPPAEGAVADSTAPARRRPPFNPLALARRAFLVATGIEDMTVTYSGTQTSASSGLRAIGYSLLDALGGRGPSLGYRLGFDRRIPTTGDYRLLTDQLQLQDNLGGNHRLDARTTLRLSSQLNVNLSWLVNWNSSSTYSFVLNEDRTGFDERPPSRNGASEGTVIGLGGGYDALLDAQYARLQADLDANDVVNNRIRSGVLASFATTADFRSAFVHGLGPFGPDNLFALPMPNWDVTYTGLTRWPILRSLTQQVQVRHGYSATYRVGYQSNAVAGQTVNTDLTPTGQTPIRLFYEQPALSPSTLTMNERFQPLVGLNVTWRGGIQTEGTWNKSTSSALTTTAGSVAETRAEELSMRVSWARTGLRLPFLRRRRLNNNLRFTLTLSRTTSTDQTLLLRQDLENLLAGTPLQRQERGQIRLSAEPRLSYTLSNQVSVDFFLRYASTEGRNSQVPTTSQLDGGVSFRVSFSN
ncbi:MAG TPA: cell surface protein SprA, partial [Rhodothermales bacterium]|nr:cell surface protein SprA [Rhodothermales bacterium]